MKIIFLILLFCISCHTNRKSIEKVDCVRGLLNEIKKSFPDNIVSVISDYEPNNARLKEWLDEVDTSELKIYRLSANNNEAILFVSYNINATGLGSNMYFWLILSKSNFSNYESLSDNPGLIFYDKKGILNYY